MMAIKPRTASTVSSLLDDVCGVCADNKLVEFHVWAKVVTPDDRPLGLYLGFLPDPPNDSCKFLLLN